MIQPIRELCQLLFQQTCIGCGQQEIIRSDLFCLKCLCDLPIQHDRFDRMNSFEQHLAGRLPFRAGFAMFAYNKEGKLQNAIHMLKYKSMPWIGHGLGERLGKEINNHKEMQDVDYIIPVPIHWKKRVKRGYNQTESIAQGVHHSTQIPILLALERRRNSLTQTKKGRSDRSKVQNKFGARSKHLAAIAGKHVLILDDVLTSGATMVACGNAILRASPTTTVSFASIAMGKAY